MPITTPLIRYNLKDRGRKHTGQSRQFNIRAICDAINGAECQERVASRGLIGYYGHMPRVRSGLAPTEGIIDKGKYVPIEPAFVTVHLKADYNGNVEHRAEFADTPAGILAAKLFDGKIGGFSSAIDERRPEFYGFDYVLEANFLQNSFRGVVLDDVYGGRATHISYDDIFQAEIDEKACAMSVLLDSISGERVMANQTIERLQAENEELLSLLVSAGTAAPTLDAAGVAPLMVSMDSANRLRRDSARFMSAPLLVPIAPPDESTPVKKQCDSLADRLLRNF